MTRQSGSGLQNTPSRSPQGFSVKGSPPICPETEGSLATMDPRNNKLIGSSCRPKLLVTNQAKIHWRGRIPQFIKDWQVDLLALSPMWFYHHICPHPLQWPHRVRASRPWFLASASFAMNQPLGGIVRNQGLLEGWVLFTWGMSVVFPHCSPPVRGIFSSIIILYFWFLFIYFFFLH